MSRKRTRVFGLPIGKRKPSLLRRAAPVLLGAVVAVLSSIARRGRDAGSSRVGRGSTDGSGDPSVEARTERSQVQAQLKAGEIDLTEVFRLADHDEAIGRTRVKVLLQHLPGVGPAGAVRAMDEIGIDAARRVRGLGTRQRDALIERFGQAG